MRRAITYLQSLHRLNPDEIVPNDVFEIAAMCDDDKVEGIIKAAQEISFDKMIIKAKELLLVRYFYCKLPVLQPLLYSV